VPDEIIDDDDDDDDDDEDEKKSSIATKLQMHFQLTVMPPSASAPGLFRCALHCLSDIEKARTTASEKREHVSRSSIIQLLPEIETMLRVAVDCEMLLERLESSDDVGLTIQYADGFSYQGDSTKYMASRTDLCLTVADLLATTDSNTDLYGGDKARIMRFAVDMVIQDEKLRTDEMANGCVRIMSALKLIKKSNEKEGLLRHVTKAIMPYMKGPNGKIDLHAVVGMADTENGPSQYRASSNQRGPRSDPRGRKGDRREAMGNGHGKSKPYLARKRVTATR
jgi:hypothetical protein